MARHAPKLTSIPAPSAPGRLVDQQEAAALAGCSKDTIIRARRAGRLPHSRLYRRRWLIAVDDLAVADLLPADHAGAEATMAGGVAGDPSTAVVELARAEAQLSALHDLLARQDDELRFLRQLAADQLRRAG